MAIAVKDNDIVISRLVKAPRDKVWEAWTEREHLEKWWGPDGFTLTTEAIDIRPGGMWKFIMHGPDGRDYDNRIVFTEIEKPRLTSHDHGGNSGKVDFRATVTFEEEAGGTRITMKSVFPSAAERDHVVKEYGAVEGGKQTLAKMAAYVEAIA